MTLQNEKYRDKGERDMRKYEDKEFIGVEEMAEIMGIGRSSAYEFIKEAPFVVIRCGAKGKLLRIPVNVFYQWYDSLASMQ